MRPGKFFLLTALCGTVVLRASGDTPQPLNLKPFVPASTVDTLGADWAALRGHQVLDGVPFQIEGAILFRGTNSGQKAHPGRTNLDNLLVAQKFEVLHLLAATDVTGDDATAVAKIHFHYADGTENIQPLLYGEHLGCWQAVWHKTEDATNASRAHVAWHGQDSAAAQLDKYRQLFHVALANPSPDKSVRELSIEWANTQLGLLLLGATVGPNSAEKLPDTVNYGPNPFPDSRSRNGDLARGEGVVKGKNSQPLAHARIRVSAIRDISTDDKTSTTRSTLIGQGAEADDNGHFIMPPLPDNHLYRLLVWAEGYENFTYRGLDPKSDPIEIHLKPLAASSLNPKYVLHGRVVGPDDKPMPFVLVEHDGVGYNGGSSWGGPQGFPEGVIADGKGEFTFGRDQQFDRLQLSIKVPGLAPAHLWVPVTNDVQTVHLVNGSTIRGRVLKDGQPLTNLAVGVSGSDRNSEVWAGNFDAKTGTNGDFIFEHLPPDTSWNFYGKMDSFKKYGALAPRLAQTANDRQETDLGDLQVTPALHLAGQVKTRTGEPLPKGLKIRVSYEDAWDSQSISVDKEGRFNVDGLSSHLVEVYAEARNWRLSATNRSLDSWNPWYLTGLLHENKDDLLLVLEKGNPQYYYGGSGNGQLPTADQSRSRPLFGAEDSGPPYIVLAGRVLDDATGKPLSEFKVTPGHKPPVTGPRPTQAPKPLLKKILEPFAAKNNSIPWNERIYWDFGHAETVSNSTFSVPFVPLSTMPVLMIEAKGYEPLETDPIPNSDTNLVLRLKKGAGPNGIVVLPNGSPAKNAIILFGISQEQFGLTGTSLNNYSGNKQNEQTTAADGKFSFDARSDGRTLFVSHPAGWVQYDISRGVDNLKLELRPWASLAGFLVDSNGAPQVGVELGLTMFHDWNAGGAMVNFQEHATTDSTGHFMFTNVPPMRIEVQRIMRSGIPSGGWTWQMQTWVVAQPGPNDLGKVVRDSPPPEPALSRIKQSLGL